MADSRVPPPSSSSVIRVHLSPAESPPRVPSPTGSLILGLGEPEVHFPAGARPSSAFAPVSPSPHGRAPTPPAPGSSPPPLLAAPPPHHLPVPVAVHPFPPPAPPPAPAVIPAGMPRARDPVRVCAVNLRGAGMDMDIPDGDTQDRADEAFTQVEDWIVAYVNRTAGLPLHGRGAPLEVIVDVVNGKARYWEIPHPPVGPGGPFPPVYELNLADLRDPTTGVRQAVDCSQIAVLIDVLKDEMGEVVSLPSSGSLEKSEGYLGVKGEGVIHSKADRVHEMRNDPKDFAKELHATTRDFIQSEVDAIWQRREGNNNPSTERNTFARATAEDIARIELYRQEMQKFIEERINALEEQKRICTSEEERRGIQDAIGRAKDKLQEWKEVDKEMLFSLMAHNRMEAVRPPGPPLGLDLPPRGTRGAMTGEQAVVAARWDVGIKKELQRKALARVEGRVAAYKKDLLAHNKTGLFRRDKESPEEIENKARLRAIASLMMDPEFIQPPQDYDDVLNDCVQFCVKEMLPSTYHNRNFGLMFNLARQAALMKEGRDRAAQAAVTGLGKTVLEELRVPMPGGPPGAYLATGFGADWVVAQRRYRQRVAKLTAAVRDLPAVSATERPGGAMKKIFSGYETAMKATLTATDPLDVDIT